MVSESSWIHDAPLLVIVAALFLLSLLLYYVGRWVVTYQKRHTPHEHYEGMDPIAGALLGLLYLLLSFTFGMSSSRYDTRRTLIYQEANCIGTVTLRTDLYPDSLRAALRADLKQYVEARISYFDAKNNKASDEAVLRAQEISGRIWSLVAKTAKDTPFVIRDGQMIPALNAMIDIVTSRDAAHLARVPDLIFYLLITLTLMGSFIIGYSRKEGKPDFIVLMLFLTMTVLTIYTILDLDRSRTGLIQSALTNTKIVELRTLFNN
jgi:hypothetical protein